MPQLSLAVASGALTSATGLGFSRRKHGLRTWGAWASPPLGVWDLPRPETEPVSPALAGRLLTSGPPGKPWFFVINRLEVLERFLSHRKIQREVQRFPMNPSSHTCRASPTVSVSAGRTSITYADTSPSPSPPLTRGVALSAVRSAGLDRYLMTCMHQYGIIQSGFTALKVLHALFIPSFLPPAAPAPNP